MTNLILAAVIVGLVWLATHDARTMRAALVVAYLLCGHVYLTLFEDEEAPLGGGHWYARAVITVAWPAVAAYVIQGGPQGVRERSHRRFPI